MRFKLNMKDYDFIDSFCKKHHISEGKGHKRIFEVFLNEYKIVVHKQKLTFEYFFDFIFRIVFVAVVLWAFFFLMTNVGSCVKLWWFC